MAKKGWGKKKIEKLIPVKKTVTKPDQGTFSQTFYVDPLKKQSKPRKPGKGEDTTGQKKTTESEGTRSRKRPKVDKTGENKKKQDDSDTDNRMVPDDSRSFKNVKDFEDFGKEGIDPESAKQFFCNM